MWSAHRVLLVTAAIVVAFGTASASILCPATDDTWISMGNPIMNYGSAVRMNVRDRHGHPSHGNQLGWDTLVRFDLSSIAHGEFVESAMLYLYYYRYSDNDPVGRELSCYRIRGDWDESTVTWNTQPETAGERTAKEQVPSAFAWLEWDVTADVRAMVSGDTTNYGWRIIDDQDPWGWYNIPITSFCSKEHGDSPPYLEVVLGTSAVENRTWGSIKALFQ